MRNNLYPLFIITALLLNCTQSSKDKAHEQSQIRTPATAGTVDNKPVKSESNLETNNEAIGIQPDDSTLNETDTSSDTIQTDSLKSRDTLCSQYTGSEQKTFEMLRVFLVGALEYMNELGADIGPIAEAAACACKTQRYKDSVQHFINSYDNKTACIDLKIRLFILQRAKPFVEKQAQLRKYLAEHSDIQYGGYWSCTPLSSYKKSLIFWCNRQNDGTKKHFEKIMEETNRLILQIEGTSPSDTGKPPCTGTTAFFTPEGLTCDAAVENIFDKKVQLIEAYIEDIFAIEYGLTGLAKRMHEGDTNHQVVLTHYRKQYNDNIAGEIKDAGMLDTLMNLKSKYFCKEYDYYALVREDEKKCYWEKAVLKPRLLAEFVPSCETIDNLKLLISTADNDSVLLFSGIPRTTKGKPSGYVSLPAPFTIDLAIACTDCDTTLLDSSISDTAWEWKIPVPDKNIKRLFAAGWHGHYEGKQLGWIELFVENEKGDHIKLDDNRFCGHSWCYDATITNPYLTDANGDGLTDVVVDASDNEKILYLQLPSGDFEKHTIKPYETHRSGGC